MKRTKKIALCGVMCALAFAFSYIEFLIPFDMTGIPGIKPGFANLVIMAALYTLGLPYAAFISFVRIVLSWLIFGNITSLLYSLAGGMLSTAVMILLKKTGFRTVTVSIAGGISHNIGQILVAMAVMNTAAIGWYLTVLWFTGMASGTLIGIIGSELCKRLPDSLFSGGDR